MFHQVFPIVMWIKTTHLFVSACQSIGRCASVDEDEASAALISLKELSKYYNGKVVLELDSAVIGNDLKAVSESFSVLPDPSRCQDDSIHLLWLQYQRGGQEKQ